MIQLISTIYQLPQHWLVMFHLVCVCVCLSWVKVVLMRPFIVGTNMDVTLSILSGVHLSVCLSVTTVHDTATKPYCG